MPAAPTAKKVRTHLKEWQEETFGGSQNPEVADTVDICAWLSDTITEVEPKAGQSQSTHNSLGGRLP